MKQEKLQRQQPLRIDGRPATQQEVSRILQAPATPVDKDDRATKPISTMSRGFTLLRK